MKRRRNIVDPGGPRARYTRRRVRPSGAFHRKSLRTITLRRGVKAVIGCPHRDPSGRVRHTWAAKAGRCRIGTRIQTVLRKKNPRRVRKNPAHLVILNPGGEAPISEIRAKLPPAQRRELDAAARRYKQFHGAAPTRVTALEATPGPHRFEVGMGDAVDLGYHVPKKFRGSNKHGTPFRHRFETKPVVTTNSSGDTITIRNRPGVRRGMRVTKWIYR